MSVILSIETATTVCSVAITQQGNLLALKEIDQANIHAEAITVFVQDALKQSGLGLADLSAVAVSMGPGSYTGLRIGVSAAKGLCYGLDKPLVAVNTLQALALKVIETNDIEHESVLCPMLDARRMEVYTAFFNTDLTEFRGTQADIIDEQSYEDILSSKTVYFIGNGMPKCREILGRSSNARFISDVTPSALYVGKVAHGLLAQNQIVNTAYFEPYYLKDFVTTAPKAI